MTSGNSATTASSHIVLDAQTWSPFAFAGVWEFIQLDGEEILSAAIVVGEPNPLVSAMRT